MRGCLATGRFRGHGTFDDGVFDPKDGRQNKSFLLVPHRTDQFLFGQFFTSMFVFFLRFTPCGVSHLPPEEGQTRFVLATHKSVCYKTLKSDSYTYKRGS